jgi:hypothetical protein
LLAFPNLAIACVCSICQSFAGLADLSGFFHCQSSSLSLCRPFFLPIIASRFCEHLLTFASRCRHETPLLLYTIAFADLSVKLKDCQPYLSPLPIHVASLFSWLLPTYSNCLLTCQGFATLCKSFKLPILIAGLCQPFYAGLCLHLLRLSFSGFYCPTFAYFADRCRCMLGAFARLANLKMCRPLPAFQFNLFQPLRAFFVTYWPTFAGPKCLCMAGICRPLSPLNLTAFSNQQLRTDDKALLPLLSSFTELPALRKTQPTRP